jgi:phosphodiesterase/alkaline phosphatase D-like protein
MNRLLALFLLMSLPLLGQKIRHGELLGRPTNKSIVIQAFFDEDAEVSVKYGTVSGTYGQQTTWTKITKGEPAEVSITGLNANTTYFYKYCYRVPGSSVSTERPERNFKTQKAPGSAFSFVVQADPHLDEQSDSSLYRLSLQNQLSDQPDFCIDLGDILMTDKLKNAAGIIPKDTVTYRAHLQRSFYETSAHSVPLFISMGNHEGESGWNLNNTAENIAVWGTLERKKYFLNPAPDGFYTGDETVHPYVGVRENFYAWTWGDALFIVLDPYWYTALKPDAATGWRWTLGKTQYDWLRATLSASKAKFKFVFAHQLIGGDPNGRGGIEFADLYEWGGKNLDGSAGFATNRPGWYKPIKDLLTENRVNIFFHGHDHFFMKQEKDCLVYQETPQPSHPNFTTATYAADYGYKIGDVYPNSGYIRVNVDADKVKVDYVRSYLAKNETATRKNKDVSVSYIIAAKNCYDSTPNNPILWNKNYVQEMVYPNPFSQTTSIEFSLTESDKINLEIYSLAGQKIRSLLSDATINDGTYVVQWDGLDQSANRVNPGTYIYRFIGEKTALKTGKIIVNP